MFLTVQTTIPDFPCFERFKWSYKLPSQLIPLPVRPPPAGAAAGRGVHATAAVGGASATTLLDVT